MYKYIRILLIGVMLTLSLLPNSSFGQNTSPTLEQEVQRSVAHLREPNSIVIVGDPIHYVDNWAFGSVYIHHNPGNDGEMEGLFFIARESDLVWDVTIENSSEFYTWAHDAPEKLISSTLKGMWLSPKQYKNGNAQLSLPWPIGETAAITGGPHKDTGCDLSTGAGCQDRSTPWAALDISGGSRKVLAAREGLAFYSTNNPCYIKIVHEGGWSTGYFHLGNVQIAASATGIQVSRSTWIANQSLCSTSGAHVHFTLRLNGNLTDIGGHTIGGWTIENGSRQYQGCVSQGSTRKCLQDGYVWLKNNGTIGTGNNPAPCSAPGLLTPSNGSVSGNAIVSFSWNTVSCSFSGFELRIKTTTDMNAGGETVINSSEISTQKSISIPQQWHNRDLYWSVRATNTPGGALWATARQFRIAANPPTIALNTANGSAAAVIDSRDQNWTFAGTAADPGNQLSRVEMRCTGEQCGSQAAHSNGSPWSHTQQGMAGKNTVSFLAYNTQGLSAESRQVELRIDLAAPQTTLSFNNEANPARWPTWYRVPVAVRLQANDQATGMARSNIDRIMYRLDGGSWQNGGAGPLAVTVGGDGSHTIEYYAVDRVGNQEATRSTTFKVDRTAPSTVVSAQETHGASSGQWQRLFAAPTFTWDASSDATAGLWGYQLYFGTDSNGIGYQSFRAAANRQWTPQPDGLRTGSYYLRIRTADLAGDVPDAPGNWSDWTTLFTFRYDGTAPENPSNITHTAPITNNVWQRTTARPDFAWPPPTDEGSGIKGYNLYWGTAETGTSASFQTINSFQSIMPLCAVNSACTGYLRLRSEDQVGNKANDWTTAYVLRYDNAAPTVNFNISGGITQTSQTLLTLQINGVDLGSGVKDMRLSNDGQTWSAWESYQSERLWSIPGISRQSWPIYLQVRDGVQLESAVISRTVYLDVNTRQPRSLSYRLFDHTLSAGSEAHVSASYQGHSTVGQVVDAAQTTSLNYSIIGGYEAGSQALPLTEPGHDSYTFINGIVASGPRPDRLRSPSYSMLGTLAEPALPNNRTTLASSSYQHQPGFLAARPALAPIAPPPPLPPPPPPPEPVRPCEFPEISVNAGSVFTRDVNVSLSICAPRAVEMKISNDGGFSTAQWEPYTSTLSWTLTAYGQYVLPRYVYAAFKESNGTIHSVYFDEIILDPTPPSGNVMIGSSIPTAGLPRVAAQAMTAPGVLALNPNGSIDLYVNGQDDNSGIAAMQISATAAYTDTTWEPYSALKPWVPQGGDGLKTVYVRFRDSAGNISSSSQASFELDRTAPVGSLDIIQGALGPDAVTASLVLNVFDNLSGTSDMRISTDPVFTDANWLPYTATLSWPVSLTSAYTTTLYTQYRDQAGNISATYSNMIDVDRLAPLLSVSADPSDSLTQTLSVSAYDNQSAITMLYLSNDPLMLEDRSSQTYTPTLDWAFDDRRVVWVQVEDAAGNRTEPHPVYAWEQAMLEKRIYLPFIIR